MKIKMTCLPPRKKFLRKKAVQVTVIQVQQGPIKVKAIEILKGALIITGAENGRNIYYLIIYKLILLFNILI